MLKQYVKEAIFKGKEWFFRIRKKIVELEE